MEQKDAGRQELSDINSCAGFLDQLADGELEVCDPAGVDVGVSELELRDDVRQRELRA